MSEQQQVSGVCSEVSERGEWTTFHIDVGREYPVKLATKKTELIELGRAASKAGGEMIWTYTERDGAENPHTGQPYKNRYLEGVAPRDAVSESAEQGDDSKPEVIGIPERGRPPIASGDKDRVIARLALLKAVTGLYAGSLGPNDVDNDVILHKIMETTKALETFVYRDVGELPFD